MFFNNGWQGPDPTMEMEFVQDGNVLSDPQGGLNSDWVATRSN